MSEGFRGIYELEKGKEEERVTFLLGEFNFFSPLFSVNGQSQIFKIWSTTYNKIIDMVTNILE